MEDRRFDGLIRRLDTAQTRRGALGRSLFAMTTAGFALNGMDAQAKKRKKKKCKKPPQTSCADACSDTCFRCLFRADAPIVCGGLAVVNACEPCSSDSDCVGASGGPYCATKEEIRETGQVNTFCGGVATCVSTSECGLT